MVVNLVSNNPRGANTPRGLSGWLFLALCLCGCFMDLSWAVTQTGSWGGGACQVVGKRGCWQRVRKARESFLLSHVLALHTPCYYPFPLTFPFQAGYDAIFHWLAIG